jgi:hypothetical protein
MSTTVPGIITAAVVVLALGLLLMIAERRHDIDRNGIGAPDDVPTAVVPLVPRDTRSARTLLVGPPMIDGCTLRDWLIHHTRRDGVWEDVVVQFYAGAAADPRVAAYFGEVDTARLQRHFLAALTVLTHAGLHRHTVERMAVVHRGVTTSTGVPITGEVWDAVVSTLVGVLVAHGAPSSVVEPLGALLDPLRAVIVVEP